jgi:hypothetical protein
MAGDGDRRNPAADELSRALLGTSEPVPFDDLAARGQVGDVAGWLGNAVEEGLVEDLPGSDGRRFFRLRRRGQVALTRGRRSTDHA